MTCSRIHYSVRLHQYIENNYYVLYVMVIGLSGVQFGLSVIIQVITKSRESDFVNHEYDYRPNWTTRSLITN